MEFYPGNNEGKVDSFPKDLSKWVENYEKGLSPYFHLYLEDEMFVYLTCYVNRKEKIVCFRKFDYPISEGDRGFAVRDSNNIFSGDEEIFFNWGSKTKKGTGIKKYNLINMDKAIFTVNYVFQNLSFPNDIRLDYWWDINDRNDMSNW